MSRGQVVAAMLAMAAAFFVGAVAAWRDHLAHRRLRSSGIRAVGDLVELAVDDNLSEAPVVAFRTSDGRAVQAVHPFGRRRRGPRDARFPAVPQRVGLVYDPRRPKRVLVDGWPTGSALLTVLGPLFAVVAVVLVLGGLALLRA